MRFGVLLLSITTLVLYGYALAGLGGFLWVKETLLHLFRIARGTASALLALWLWKNIWTLLPNKGHAQKWRKGNKEAFHALSRHPTILVICSLGTPQTDKRTASTRLLSKEKMFPGVTRTPCFRAFVQHPSHRAQANEAKDICHLQALKTAL